MDQHESKRLFCAIKVVPEEKMHQDYACLRDELKNHQVKWVPEENMHLTLWFFGSTKTAKIPLLMSKIEQSLHGIPPFVLELKSAGTFGKQNSPAVIWVGAADRSGTLEIIYQKLKSQLEQDGFTGNSQKLNPHITIGRIKSSLASNEIHEALIRRRCTAYQENEISEIVLFESILGRNGPVYEPLQSFSLKAGAHEQ